jgi:hypothetical protein
MFRVKTEVEAVVVVEGGFNVFYPQAPTLEEARGQARRYEGAAFKTMEWTTPVAEKFLRSSRIKYRPIYNRLRVNFSGKIDIGKVQVDKTYHLAEDVCSGISASIQAAEHEAAQNCNLTVSDATHHIRRTLPGTALLSEPDFRATRADYSRPVVPRWQAEVVYRAWRGPDAGSITLEVLLSNRLDRDAAKNDMDAGLEPYLFSPVLVLDLPAASLAPFDLVGMRRRDYRSGTRILASGINCDSVEDVSAGRASLSTDILPVYRQMRQRSRALPDYPEGAPTFADLDSDPLPHLQRLVCSLEAYEHRWRTEYRTYVAEGKVPDGVEPEYLEAAREFSAEVQDLRDAVTLLSRPESSDLLTAFRLVNRVFERQYQGRFSTWRLFQLVFLVTSIAHFAYRTRQGTPNPTPSPVVLSYSTGGGKTEAYLSVILAHSFWDRLRGKGFGTSAWCKFPLRLLGMQQLSRFVTSVTFANEVLSSATEVPRNRKGEPFSVGLFAGGENSSNDLDWPTAADRVTQLSSDCEELIYPNVDPGNPLLQKNRKIDSCPVCRSRGFAEPGPVDVSFDGAKPGFIHRCRQCGIRLELHVSDTEVLRFLPTVIVSTIDKMAEVGREPATKILFGFARSHCRDHGYFLSEAGKCNVLACGKPTESVVDPVDPGPGLLIQDEMHFLRETLGAFDSHYETMMLSIGKEAARRLPLHGGPWRIIGSSATIEGYEEQVRQVYGLSGANGFPAPGPTRTESFYFEEVPGEVQRYVLGFRPHNMSHVDAVMKVLLSYHRAVAPLAELSPSAWESLDGTLQPTDNCERAMLISRYRTSLAYCLTRMEAGQVNKSFAGQLNPILNRDGLPEFEDGRVENLSSEMGAAHLQRVLHRLENPGQNWVQSITATSIISHGVDLDVLNFMVFRGQPHTIGEWIQAMSRVGRKPGVPSIVVNVYNPNRERDASYYRHHKGYIRHAGSLLKNIPVTRFSRTAATKTFPGLFYNAVSFFAAPVECRYYFTDQLRRFMPRIRPAVDSLLEAYYNLPSAAATPKEARLRESVNAEMEGTLAILEHPSTPEKTVAALRPMISLREVEETVTIIPEYDYERFQ